MKQNIKQNDMWWSWTEFCDRCGKPIRCRWVRGSEKPNTEENDLCVSCSHYLLDNKISYADACKKYKEE